MERLITDLLDETVKKYPQKEALSDEIKSYTFRQLQELSMKIATGIVLKTDGVVCKPIAVCFDKEIDEIAAFMGVLYSGNFYTPIDPQMPINRIQSILELLNPICVIASKKICALFNNLNKAYNVYSFESLCESSINYQIINRCANKIIDTDPAYILFTSGSTGVPKGVVVSHKSVISYAHWVENTFRIDPNEILGNQTPFYFSMSVLDIYTTILTGCKLVLIPHKFFSSPDKLLDYVISHEVTTIYWVPSVLISVANSHALERKKLANIRKVLFAGEVMPNKQLNIWRKFLPNAFFANLFGPTEFTDICTYYVVEREFGDDEPLPIGYECLNSSAFLLDDKNNLITRDESDCIGELCIRGIQLAYGYYNNHEKTTEVFVQNPLNMNYPEIIYRTGDLAKYNEYGELIYAGRKDFQIKISGYRIELGEIETAVSSVKEIELNCCIFDDNNQIIMCVYVGAIDKKELRAHIKELVPRYMVPHKYIKVDSLPLNANGKIDRVKIKKQYVG